MHTLARVLYQDPFSPILLSGETQPLVVSNEQRAYIREILEIGASDSRFAQKMYDAISFVLTSGPVVPPVVSSLSPNTVVVGSPSFDIHVMGTGFTPTSKIIFNGFEEPTTYVSATELTTGVDMGVWAAAVDVPVAVQAANGVMSAPMTFSFTDTAARLAEMKEIKKAEELRQKLQAEAVKNQLEDAKKAEDLRSKVQEEAVKKQLADNVKIELQKKEEPKIEVPHTVKDKK